MNGFHQGLIDEIEFWRELINESRLSVDSPEYKRMEYALQLAEIKLAKHERIVDSSVSQALKVRARLFISKSKKLIANN